MKPVTEDVVRPSENENETKLFPSRRGESTRTVRAGGKNPFSRLSMSAKDAMRCNKTAIQLILSADVRLILDKVYERKIITDREYKNIKSMNRETNEGRVIELVDKIMDKGEARCKDFLDLLQTDDEIKDTFPELQDKLSDYTDRPHRPTQETSSAENRDDVASENKEPKQEELHQLDSELASLSFIRNNSYSKDHEPARGSDAGESISSDAETVTRSISVHDETEYYPLTHNPRGWCVVINNERFTGIQLRNRRGTQEDAKALREVFTRLGFKVDVENDLTADAIKTKLQNLGKENFLDHDALVVCVLSNGREGLVYGTDEHPVYIRELKQPFTSERAPTLAGKPKLFFIQACQGTEYQRGSLPCLPRPRQEEDKLTQAGKAQRQETMTQISPPHHYVYPSLKLSDHDALQVTMARLYKVEERKRCLEEVHTVASDADFLLGMATVPGCTSFRRVTTGSIYIQELCKQLMISAGSSALDDILHVLLRVNREVSKGVFNNYKQMPQPVYTLTKRLVLKFV